MAPVNVRYIVDDVRAAVSFYVDLEAARRSCSGAAKWQNSLTGFQPSLHRGRR
jgi:hypothetical protein